MRIGWPQTYGTIKLLHGDLQMDPILPVRMFIGPSLSKTYSGRVSINGV